MPEATREAADLLDQLAIDVELIQGEKGVFDVRVDGELIFSKHKEKRFPSPGELVRRLRHAS